MDSPATSEYQPLLNPRTIPGSPPAYDGSLNTVSLEDTPSSTAYRAYKRWPWFIWLLLKIIGLYNCRRVVTTRWCHMCRLAVLQRRHREGGEEMSGCGLYPGAGEDQGGDEEEEDGKKEHLICVVDYNRNEDLKTQEDDDCVVCRSEWWDSRGRYRPYSETDIGVRKWNHCGSAIPSLIWPLTLIALIMYDFFYYLRNYWGQEKQLIRLISYSTFLFFNMSSPLLSLVANIRNMVVDHMGTRRRRGFSWYEGLGMRYIVKRLQHLEMGERGLPYKPYLAVCLLWPCLNGAYRVVIYYVLVNTPKIDVHIEISLGTGMVCMIVWGNFCYLMLLLRLSFQKQIRLELAFLWRHAGNVDVCRRRVALYAEDLGSMCRLVSIWIIIVVAVSTWAFTTQVCWDYLMISNDIQFRNIAIELNINLLIWSENTMFLVLPLVAIGGINLNGMWVQFQRGISRMRCEAQEEFWDKIFAFCEEQSPVYRVETLTLIFSALGLFLGLHFGDQNVEYWIKQAANATMILPALGP